MSYLTDLMSVRKNIQFFKEEAPDKSIIDDILKQAHELVPHKNNFWYYKIRVFGPEHKEEKKIMAMISVTGERRDEFKKGDESKMEELAEIYDEWANRERILEIRGQNTTGRKSLKVEGCSFNIQVTAPYLLVYTHQPDYVTESQKKSKYFESGRQEKTFREKVNKKGKDWIIQSAMHGISTAYLCAEKGLYASFCRCYFYNQFFYTDILRPDDNTAFMLGIGYKDETKQYYPSLVKKPTYDEIVEWL
tara:strand:+ start:245 stop:988 length:744 start_codon:yes stop_codon:yes gene_type:complete